MRRVCGACLRSFLSMALCRILAACRQRYLVKKVLSRVNRICSNGFPSQNLMKLRCPVHLMHMSIADQSYTVDLC